VAVVFLLYSRDRFVRSDRVPGLCNLNGHPAAHGNQTQMHIGGGAPEIRPGTHARDFANCTQMHRHDHRYRVARSDALPIVRYALATTGPPRGPGSNRANSESDADHDGTVCEVTR